MGEPVSDVRPYLAPVDELIEANYKRTEGGRGGRGEGGERELRGGRGEREKILDENGGDEQLHIFIHFFPLFFWSACMCKRE